MISEDHRVNRAVRYLMEVTKDELILYTDPHLRIYIVPSIIKDEHNRLEYQVSDGLPGRRAQSNDFETFSEAMAFVEQLKTQGGWKEV